MIEAEGVVAALESGYSLKVKDGQMFLFSTAQLEELLARALEGDGRVVVFVRTQEAA